MNCSFSTNVYASNSNAPLISDLWPLTCIPAICQMFPGIPLTLCSLKWFPFCPPTVPFSHIAFWHCHSLLCFVLQDDKSRSLSSLFSPVVLSLLTLWLLVVYSTHSFGLLYSSQWFKLSEYCCGCHFPALPVLLQSPFCKTEKASGGSG